MKTANRHSMTGILDSVANGMAMISPTHLLRAFNTSFQAMWRFSGLRIGQPEGRLWKTISNQLLDAEAFLDQVARIYAADDQESFDLLRLADGRVFEMYSTPEVAEDEPVGRLWSFHDLTRAVEWDRKAGRAGRGTSVTKLAAAIARDFSHVFKGPASTLNSSAAIRLPQHCRWQVPLPEGLRLRTGSDTEVELTGKFNFGRSSEFAAAGRRLLGHD